ncbi:HNH endonuclease [Fulvivirga sp. 1062]|uniref:HNH endonuclease n=1 Tax=Fulvivirga sedimenti TaxID=2879465 RepID=A0A9X1HQ69_9BACT|nr:HNH endonuclease [Fulvivirga sedimenti]MCA6076367.1 HNH endonuclease [Fulvivirga sedimenti]MCA6077495.1 HNH endonuclease [Fulvivirga sedimenti]
MNRKVLVLNQDYSPISVCTVQRAFLLTFLRKTEMVESANGHVIRSVSQSYPMPAVIRLTRYIHIPYKGVALTRQNVFKRDNFNCQYCGTHNELTLDHVMPRSRGGKSSWDNLITACKRCNAFKGDYTPEEAGISLQYKPFRPSYVMFLRDYSGYHCDEWRPYLKVGK